MGSTAETLQGQWREVQGQIRRRWGKLTEDDLAQMHGRQEELVNALQKRYGYDKMQAEREIDEWLRSRP